MVNIYFFKPIIPPYSRLRNKDILFRFHDPILFRVHAPPIVNSALY